MISHQWVMKKGGLSNEGGGGVSSIVHVLVSTVQEANESSCNFFAMRNQQCAAAIVQKIDTTPCKLQRGLVSSIILQKDIYKASF